MWELYRRTLMPMQTMILIIAVIFLFVIHAPLPSVLILYLILQAFALLGAAWGVRLRGKVDRARRRRGQLL